MDLINTYNNGDFDVSIYEDGTKVRTLVNIQTHNPKPAYPESLDVKITNYCDAGCPYCHEESNIKGEHGDLGDSIKLLKQLPAGVEIAIGGGNPLSHPNLYCFCKQLKETGLICNLTINKLNLISSSSSLKLLEQLITEDLIKGIGYSTIVDLPERFISENLVIHLIIGVTPVSRILEMMDKSNSLSINKFLLLGYKTFGFGVRFNSKRVQENIRDWKRSLLDVLSKAQQKDLIISMDNLAIEQLDPKRLYKNPNDFDNNYMGDEGQFNMYLDAVNREYAISSFSSIRYLYKDTIEDMFRHVRETAI